MSSPWSAPDAGSHREPSTPPAPPPPPGRARSSGADPRADADPFAPPTGELELGPVVPGSVYGRGAPPGAYGPPPAWPTLPGTDPMAVAALVCGILALLVAPFPFGPAALGLGLGSLRRVSRQGLGGRRMAVAGVVLGAVGTVLMLIAGAFIGLVVLGSRL
jgi:hypothetical protein